MSQRKAGSNEHGDDRSKCVLSLCTAVLHGTLQRHMGASRYWPDRMWPMLTVFPTICAVGWHFSSSRWGGGGLGVVWFKAFNLLHASGFLVVMGWSQDFKFPVTVSFLFVFKNGGSGATWWGWPGASVCSISGMVGFIPSPYHWIS